MVESSFFVRRGEARAYLGPDAPVWGQSVEVAIIKAGSYFGELAMLTGLPRGSFVMATSHCICSVLPYSAVENLVGVHPEAFTTLVQTMVRMYNLKPETTWKELSSRLTKKFAIQNDEDAFMWFRAHDDHPDPEELHARAFDLALQKLKVSHLDRRIFWSELDRDASGGISYEEFKGKLHFKPAEIVPSGSESFASYSTFGMTFHSTISTKSNSLESAYSDGTSVCLDSHATYACNSSASYTWHRNSSTVLHENVSIEMSFEALL